MNFTIIELLQTLIKECFIKRYFITAVFIIFSLVVLGVGVNWPKKYTASTVIQIDDRNIIEPLMQGAAVRTGTKDHAKNSREIILSSKILDKVIKHVKWVGESSTPLEIQNIKNSIISNTKIVNVGKGERLIKIIFSSNDPNLTYLTVKNLAAFFLEEGKSSKVEESRAAFEFIERQVESYAAKLKNLDEKIKHLLENVPDARPGTQDRVSGRITTLQGNIETTVLELRESEIKKTSLEKQLSGEAALSVSQTRETQINERINQLQLELEDLLLIYTDTYPDVIRKREQIKELKKTLKGEIASREKKVLQARDNNADMFDANFSKSAIYETIKKSLSETDTEIVTLKTRLDEMKGMLNSEYDRLKRIQVSETQMNELNRDYQVNKEIYQDLLKRRENARVSRSLGAEEQGMTFKIQEPAKFPLSPTGLRFLHFILIGLFGGVLVAVGAVYGLMMIDGKIRVSRMISDLTEMKVMVEIPHYTTLAEKKKIHMSNYFISGAVLMVLCVYAYVSFLKFNGSL